MSDNPTAEPDWKSLQDRIIGLGENSIRKNHYPELKARIRELERVKSLLNMSQDIFLILDTNSLQIIEWNISAQRHLGYDHPPAFELIDHGKALSTLRRIKSCNLQSDCCLQSQSLISDFIRADGSTLPVEMTISFESEVETGSAFAIIVARDITERLEAETYQRQATAVFENTMELILILSSDRIIISVNPAVLRLSGFTPDEIIGKHASAFRGDRQGSGYYDAVWDTVERDGKWQGEIWGRISGDEEHPFWGSISRIDNEQGQPTQYIYVLSDIAKIKEAESRLAHLSNHHPLTQLPNRLMMMSVLHHAIRRATPTQTILSLILLDIDRFKSINDTLGHKAGDSLLQAVAERILVSAPTATLVAHTSGDEFAILLENLASTSTAGQVADNILRAFREPVHLDGFEVFVSLSIGLSHFPAHGSNSGDISRNSDAAMHQAKLNGGNQVKTYTPELTKVAFQNLQIETSLRQAIESKQLELYYQPQFRLSDNRLCGAEALVRWQHPSRGIIAPNVFIPRAEETGLIIPMGEQLLRQACIQVSDWLSQGLPVVPVAVNVSGIQFNNSNFVETVEKVLRQTGTPPQYIKLEITESFAMSQTSGAVAALHKIRDLGIELSIDDFGTGYSSLAYLRDLPVTTLKIDREFTKNLPDHQGDSAITKAIVAMAQSIGMQVVAEGVENLLQLSFLQSIGCDIMQGYYGGRPVPAAEFLSQHLQPHAERAKG